ncbi:MAG: aminomethyl-transferring glycine dehydrogenase subunit GcvPB [Candidatus Goldbacteria bacterium]|nr:aminomethyl-transferring glycine dehydrogenase subunit GcvPB [Candidatus Goldiibacteriota bacterium]
MNTIFDKSVTGRKGFNIETPIKDAEKLLDKKFKRLKDAELPQVSELDVIRHFTNLSRLNFSVDTHFYPLGSCTMKYNPKINEKVSILPGFSNLHPITPYVDYHLCQGALEVIYNLSYLLCEITGMKKMTTQPYAGAHGELTGILLMAAYHKARGNKRKYVIVPESAHGTNPASAAMAGYSVISIPVNSRGEMDIDIFKEKMTEEVAGIMMTVPSTLGVFENNIKEIIEIVHKYDAIAYYDGANLNAILGKLRPGDVGFDIVHINLHKTFGTPHGGGGPGSGVVGVSDRLCDFLPVPLVERNNKGIYYLDFSVKNTIGQVASFYGNFAVLLKAYAYIIMLGKEGLIDITEKAVLNANYIMKKLKNYYHLPFDRTCMHEVVFTAKNQIKNGVHAVDIAKYLIDNNIHPPTIYFPLVVEEAIMIEPTETESKQTIDNFVDVMIDIANLAEKEPEKIKNSPFNTVISRPDETKAAREIKLTCDM